MSLPQSSRWAAASDSLAAGYRRRQDARSIAEPLDLQLVDRVEEVGHLRDDRIDRGVAIILETVHYARPPWG